MAGVSVERLRRPWPGDTSFGASTHRNAWQHAGQGAVPQSARFWKVS